MPRDPDLQATRDTAQRRITQLLKARCVAGIDPHHLAGDILDVLDQLGLRLMPPPPAARSRPPDPLVAARGAAAARQALAARSEQETQ